MNKKYTLYYIFSEIGIILLSYYPLYMGYKVVRDMNRYGFVPEDNYPKYIIPYTPICIALIVGILLMPLLIKLAKKFAFALASVLIIFVVSIGLIACGSDKKEINTSEEVSSVEKQLIQVKEAGCVTFEDGDITSGEDVWQEFLSEVEQNHVASVKLADYYTLDPEQCDPEYYESVKDDYPMLFIKELTYDGLFYTIRWTEDDKEYVKNYKYLMRYEDEPVLDSALFETCVRYVLVNDNTVTWDDIWKGLISSQMNAGVEHTQVYSDYIYENE